MNRREIRISINDRLLFLETQLLDLLAELENNQNIINVRLYVLKELRYILKNWKFIKEQIKSDLYDIVD